MKIFAAEITKLIDEYARNKNIMLTILMQHAAQVDPDSLKSLWGMATGAFGRVADYETAELLSKTFFPIDPYKKKRDSFTYLPDSPTYQYIISDRLRYTSAPHYSLYPINPVEFTPVEQVEMNARKFMKLGRFQFLVKTAQGEGDASQAVKLVDFSSRIRGIWVNENIVSRIRQMLWEQEGQPIEEVLAEINARGRVSRKVATTDDQLAVIEEEIKEVVPPTPAVPPVSAGLSAQEVLTIFDDAFAQVKALLPETWQLP